MIGQIWPTRVAFHGEGGWHGVIGQSVRRSHCAKHPLTLVRLRVLLDLYRSACSRRPWKKAMSISTTHMYLSSYEKGAKYNCRGARIHDTRRIVQREPHCRVPNHVALYITEPTTPCSPAQPLFRSFSGRAHSQKLGRGR